MSAEGKMRSAWLKVKAIVNRICGYERSTTPTRDQMESVVSQLRAIDKRICAEPGCMEPEATPIIIQQAIGEMWVEADWTGFTDRQRANVIERVIEGFSSTEWMDGIGAAGGGYEPGREPWLAKGVGKFDRAELLSPREQRANFLMYEKSADHGGYGLGSGYEDQLRDAAEAGKYRSNTDRGRSR